jgi:hypothetical protein
MAFVARLLVLVAVAGQVKGAKAQNDSASPPWAPFIGTTTAALAATTAELAAASPAQVPTTTITPPPILPENCQHPPCQDVHVTVNITGVDYWRIAARQEAPTTFKKRYAQAVSNANTGLIVDVDKIKDMYGHYDRVTVSYGGAPGSTVLDCIVSISVNRTQEACKRLLSGKFARHIHQVTRVSLGNDPGALHGAMSITPLCRAFSGHWEAQTTVQPPTPTVPIVAAAAPMQTTPAPSGPSFWMWLAPLLVLFCLGGLGLFFYEDKILKKAPARKRAVRTTHEHTAPLKQDVEAPRPPEPHRPGATPLTALPTLMSVQMPVAKAQPVHSWTTQVPTYSSVPPAPFTTVVPTTTAIPVATPYAPQVQAVGMAPDIAQAAPVCQPATAPVNDVFSMFDTNNDGVISREEFTQATAPAAYPAFAIEPIARY